MNSQKFHPTLAALGAMLTLVAALAEPTQGPPVQAHGGDHPAILNDLEYTAITRAEEGYLEQVNTLQNARSDLTAASFLLPPGSPEFQARVRAVADAELALALSRADAFMRLKTEFGITDDASVRSGTPSMEDATNHQRLQALVNSISGDTDTRGRGVPVNLAPSM